MMPATIRISILSDSRLFRDAVSSCLILEDAIEVLGAVGSVRDLLESGLAERTEVVLVFRVDPADTAETTSNLKTLLPSVRVVVAGCRAGQSDAVRAIEAGALACLGDDAPYRELVAVIRATVEGRASGSLAVLVAIGHRIDEMSATTEQLLADPRRELSARETTVARLVALGLANKRIARDLNIKLSTVKKHVHSMLRKLQVERRRDLVGLV